MHPDLGRIVWLVGTLIEETIGGDVHDRSMEAGHAALVVRQKLDIRAQSGTNHVDVLGPHARADDETVLPGHEIHQRSARPITPPGVWTRRSVMTPPRAP